MWSHEALTSQAFHRIIGKRKPLEREEDYHLRAADPFTSGLVSGEVERQKKQQMEEQSRGFKLAYNKPFG